MTSLQKHAQKVVMETTPYKNQLFVTYAVKAAFERDPTVPPVIVDAVQHAVEQYTQTQTQALRGGDALNGNPGDGEVEDAGWKRRLAEAIEMVVEQEQKMESLGGGGESEEEVPVPRQRVRFTEQEVKALTSGVKIHGEGKWARILQDKRLHFHDTRTAASLKDKWRNLRA
jgi:hypothetical protein